MTTPAFNTISDVVNLIGEGHKVQFVSLLYRAKETGELARYVLIVGASVETLYDKDIQALYALIPSLDGVKALAASELLNSRLTSLEKGIGNNPAYTCQGVYAGLTIPGLKVHIEDGVIHLSGLVQDKKVIEAGTYKKVNSSEKTLAKREIEKSLPSGRFRQFRIHKDNLRTFKANGDILIVEVE